MVERQDHGWVKDVLGGDPGPFFRSVPLPTHQVVVRPPQALGVKEGLDRTGQCTADIKRRGCTEVRHWRMEKAHRLEKGHMEG